SAPRSRSRRRSAQPRPQDRALAGLQLAGRRRLRCRLWQVRLFRRGRSAPALLCDRLVRFMSGTAMLHPDFKATPYWWEGVPEIETPEPPPARVDVAIIGSGYCGLSAAIELARSGASVAVVDAGRIGEGASTRNGGMISAGLKLPADLEARVGPARAALVRKEAMASLSHLEDMVARESISCDLQMCG